MPPPPLRQQAKAKRAQNGAAARKSAAAAAKPRGAAGARAVKAGGVPSAPGQAASLASTAIRVTRAQAGNTAAQQPPATAGKPEAGQIGTITRPDTFNSAAEHPSAHQPAARGGGSKAIKRSTSRSIAAAKASATEPRTHVAGQGGKPSRSENHDPNSTHHQSGFSGALALLAIVAAWTPGTCIFVVLLTFTFATFDDASCSRYPHRLILAIVQEAHLRVQPERWQLVVRMPLQQGRRGASWLCRPATASWKR